MEIRNRTLLVLGGAGLVGMAVCRRLLREGPSAIVVCSIDKASAEAASAALQKEYPSTKVSSEWGNIFVRRTLKDMSWNQILASSAARRAFIADTMDPMAGNRKREILESSTLAHFMAAHQPNAVIDCINTATAFAYQNIYASAGSLLSLIEKPGESDPAEVIEQHICKLYTPQLVRHVQILNEIFVGQAGWPGPQAYIKIGTTGTGGMGINIPYTHGEEKPSAQLLSKTAMAGAHSLLLFLLARTPPENPKVKEVKPAAAIAWKAIQHGEIRRRGKAIQLYDCPFEKAKPLDTPGILTRNGEFGHPVGKSLRSVYIDTGENGLFSMGEFSAITHLGQMEFVTPEEIAHMVSLELGGGNSGFDIISALDQSVMGPTYRAGMLRASAIARMRELTRKHSANSIAFELLGPPRLSKLLFEAELLKRISDDSISRAVSFSEEELSNVCLQEIEENTELRQQALSIGIGILLPDARLLRGPELKAHKPSAGWIDLTQENMKLWKKRLAALQRQVASEIASDSCLGSSRFDQTFIDPETGLATNRFEIGEIVGWLFNTEEKGQRLKS